MAAENIDNAFRFRFGFVLWLCALSLCFVLVLCPCTLSFVASSRIVVWVVSLYTDQSALGLASMRSGQHELKGAVSPSSPS